MASSSNYYQRNNHQRIPSLLIASTLLLLSFQNATALVVRSSSSISSSSRSRQLQSTIAHNHHRQSFAPPSVLPTIANNPQFTSQYSSVTVALSARNRKTTNYDDDDDDDWDAYFDGDEEDDDDYYDPPPSRRGRSSSQRQQRRIDNLGTPPLTGSSPDDTSLSIPSSFGRGDTGLRLPSSVSAALLAGVFVLGIGTGVTVDSQINTNPKDLASRDAVDKNAPNPTLCTTYGASAMAFDQRVFVSFNPFNVYVAQADVKPACVLRPANIVPVLKERKLLDDNEIRGCKMNMNTWAFVGDLNDQPQLSCVYKSEDAQNEFLEDPKRGIGEDYLDDDRAKIASSTGKKTGKMVKDTLTEAQRKMILDMGDKKLGGSGGGSEMF